MIDFKDITYLKNGNSIQQKAYKVLIELEIFETLREFAPVLTGTIPIEINIDNSDLDIVCYCENLNQFKSKVISLYGKQTDFEIQQKLIRKRNTIVARFKFKGFLFELFGQNRLVDEQEAYRHMLIEYKVLKDKGENFRLQIIELKKQGFKTEPAFAKLLGLTGDPYEELLKI